ncbi:Tannase [Dactylellina cionopaga]|nr:Tannase [Dactylellina cionopaga]
MADLCRLRVNITTSTTSSVIAEAWMPVDWEDKGKRFVMTGNGGWGGCIPYGDMAYTSSLGFAVVGHNNGHDGGGPQAFFNRPEVLKDFVVRGLQVATKIGKTAVNHFYEQTLNKSYYYGCSTGGRQGLKAAQEFPEEYDGIVAAAPAMEGTKLYLGNAHYYFITGEVGAPTYLSYEQWTAVVKATLAQCDGIDGVMDGVIEDPMQCSFRPEAMLCAPGQTWASNQCLTSTQVSSVRKVFEPYYGNNGRLIFPNTPPGGDVDDAYSGVYGPTAYKFAEGFLQNAIYSDRSWSFRTDYNLDVADHVIDTDIFQFATNKTDLTELQASGHKLLVYHGLADSLIPAANSYQYYENVARNMSLPSSSLDQFFRFFPVAGLHHCSRGSGTGYVGGPNQSSTPGAALVDPNDSVLMTMVKWVENGVAPETLRGYKSNAGGTAIEKVKDHCKHPLKTTYKGMGNDPNLRTSWECK